MINNLKTRHPVLMVLVLLLALLPILAACQGPEGNQGQPGLQGAAGATGPSGASGSSGLQGPEGRQGSPGAPGAEGKQGLAGPQGPEGKQGPVGVTGPPGPGKVTVLVVDPVSISLGQGIGVFGSGFPPIKEVEIWLQESTGALTLMGKLTPNAAGSFVLFGNWRFSLGIHKVYVKDVATGEVLATHPLDVR